LVAVPHSRPVDPSLFIEESGKTTVTDLVDVAPYQQIATLAAGDKLTVVVDTGVVRLVGPGDIAVGQLEPKIAQRVTRLTAAGNRYSATITSIDENHVRIIVREEFRHPSMRSRPSFPTQAALVRPDTRDSVFRPDLDDEEDETLEDIDGDVETVDVADGDVDAAGARDDADADDDA
jgi:hypothetical protein